MDRILVTGATGQVGSAVVRALVSRGIQVRAATRKTTKISWTDFIQPVRFDYEDAGLHRAALDEASGLFLVAPPLDLDAPAKLIPFIDKAREMGIKHLIFNSALGANANEQTPLRIIENHIIKSGIPYTILRPNFFMENFTTGRLAPMIAEGGIFLAAGDGQTSFISVDDIAEVAAVAFEKKHYGAEYNLTGPEALSHGKVAATIFSVSGHTVTYHPLSEEEMIQGARDKGVTENAIKYLTHLYSAVRGGFAAIVTGDVKAVTGRAPISFKEFAKKNAGLWRMREAA